jgi:hypothetical protein
MSDARRTQDQFRLSGLRFQAARPEVWKEEEPLIRTRQVEAGKWLFLSSVLSVPLLLNFSGCAACGDAA